MGFTVTVRVGAKVIVAVGKIVGSGVFVSTGFSSIVGATVETNVAVGLQAANKINCEERDLSKPNRRFCHSELLPNIFYI